MVSGVYKKIYRIIKTVSEEEEDTFGAHLVTFGVGAVLKLITWVTWQSRILRAE